MKRLLTARHAFEAHHWVNLLRAAGIPAQVQGEYLAGAFGDLPADACAAQVWISNPKDEPLARSLIAEAQTPHPAGPWRCACGESIEAQFFACWRCGEHRPE
jgi:hypothetical protein